MLGLQSRGVARFLLIAEDLRTFSRAPVLVRANVRESLASHLTRVCRASYGSISDTYRHSKIEYRSSALAQRLLTVAPIAYA